MSRLDALPHAGPAHPLVRRYLDLKRRRSAGPERAVALEGLWTLRYALDANVAVEAVLVCPDLVRGPDTHRVLARASAAGAECVQVSGKVLRRVVDRDGPDGIAHVVHAPRHRLRDLPVGPRSLVVVVDGLELPGNIGSIIRTADGAGASGVIITTQTTRSTHPLVIKASMGTALTTPIVETTTEQLLGWVRRHAVQLVAADPGASRSYRDHDYADRVAIAVGNERLGLSAELRSAADVTVSIPMLGGADSLNVGHAAALLLYEVVHQRRHRGGHR